MGGVVCLYVCTSCIDPLVQLTTSRIIIGGHNVLNVSTAAAAVVVSKKASMSYAIPYPPKMSTKQVVGLIQADFRRRAKRNRAPKPSRIAEALVKEAGKIFLGDDATAVVVLLA